MLLESFVWEFIAGEHRIIWYIKDRSVVCELTFVFLYIICAFVETVLMCTYHKYYGDTQGTHYDLQNYQVIVHFVFFICMWILSYLYYIKTRHRKGMAVGKKFYVEAKFTCIMTIWLGAYIIYTYITKVGIIGSHSISSLSPVFSALDVTAVFYIYYVLFRNKKQKLYVVNTILFCVLRIMQGTTAFILNLAMFELYFYCKNHKIKKNLILSITVVTVIIFGGALLYKYLFPLKLAIRNGYNFDLGLALPYDQALSKLISRFSTFSRGSFALFNMDKIKKVYINQKIFLAEIKDIFKPIVPRFIMQNKEYSSLSHCIFTAAFENLGYETGSSSPGIIVYTIMIIYSDPLAAIIWFPMYIISFKAVKRLYASLEINSVEEFDILYFYLITQFVMTGYLNVLIMRSTMKLIYIGPILYLMGIIKKKDNTKSYIRGLERV